MKLSGTRKMLGLLGGFLLVFTIGGSAFSGTLFEFYSNASNETLKTETEKIGAELRAVFDHTDVQRHQRQIDFAEYFANLKKMVGYGTRLAVYSDYNRDLRFARDNQIFKGLPEDLEKKNRKDTQSERKDFVRSKYDRMKANVEEEIDTYLDLVNLSLDACETLVSNDLTGILDSEAYQERVRDFMKGGNYKKFEEKKGRLQKAWPGIAGRISMQLSLWQAERPSSDAPIIDPKIAGAIRNERNTDI